MKTDNSHNSLYEHRYWTCPTYSHEHSEVNREIGLTLEALRQQQIEEEDR